MLVEYSSQPATETIPGQEVPTLLEQVKLGALPVFAVRGTGIDPEELWHTTLQHARTLGLRTERKVFTVSRFIKPEEGDQHTLPDDIGLHMDIMPTTPDAVRSIRVHQLLGGAYLARFFEIAPGYTEPVKAHYSPDHLPEGTFEHYMRGQVDPEILTPLCHELTAQQGDLVIFRMSGRRPLAHDFQTTAFPRVFRLITLDLP